MSDGPEKQENRSGGEERRHGVDHNGHLADVAESEIHEETGGKHEDRVARRVTDFKFVALRNELGAVPEARGGFQRQQIGDGGYYETQPTQRIVDKIVFFHNAILQRETGSFIPELQK